MDAIPTDSRTIAEDEVLLKAIHHAGLCATGLNGSAWLGFYPEAFLVALEQTGFEIVPAAPKSL